ncbi:hypothetical protein GCM10011313_14370 [Mycetocola zhadangensis]|nr:hypothetical protein GCM10011313_14370 [Mycetocola zhadangensis]
MGHVVWLTRDAVPSGNGRTRLTDARAGALAIEWAQKVIRAVEWAQKVIRAIESAQKVIQFESNDPLGRLNACTDHTSGFMTNRTVRKT